MLQESIALREEADELHAFLRTLDEADWNRTTGFKSWTPWDVVAHLHYFDHFSVLALTDADGFAKKRGEMIEQVKARKTGAEITRDELGELAPDELLGRWIETCHDMAQQLGESNPKRRLPWFGPDMGVRMFTTARLMETWAHGQEIYDLKRVHRTHTDRIESIAVIGVKTFGWTFVNRGQEPPGPPPYVRLVAPSGEIWEGNEPSEAERVSGDAVDFCRTVTQVRNVADTDLEVVGEVAQSWMEIAQCFAGGAEDPPKPGQRSWS